MCIRDRANPAHLASFSKETFILSQALEISSVKQIPCKYGYATTTLIVPLAASITPGHDKANGTIKVVVAYPYLQGKMCIRDSVKGASYDEMVDIQLKDGTTRAGRIVQIEGEKVVVQVFEGTNGLSLENTKTRLLGKPMELPVSKEILGRIFSGAGRPIDGLGEVYAEAEIDVYKRQTMC